MACCETTFAAGFVVVENAPKLVEGTYPNKNKTEKNGTISNKIKKNKV